MKRILLLQIFLFAFSVGYSQGIQRWFENFEGEANNAVSGTAAGTPGGTWSVTTTPSGGAATFSRQSLGFNRFTINQTGTEGVWASSVVDISSTGQAALDISLVSYYGGSGDYVRAYYKLNGGAEVLFGEAIGQTGAYNITSQASIVLTGSTVQIIVRGRENTAGSTGGFPNMMRFDDVEITQVSTLYSRNGGGNWGTSGTWSTVGLNGVSCACTPDNTTNVVVGNSDVVSITAASAAINITVQNSSTLRWTTNNVALNVSRGGSVTVSNTAQINHNGNTGASIVFPVAAAVGLTVNSSNANALLIGDISVTGAPTLTISGTGNITTADDFLVSGGATIVNNLGGTIAVGDAITINPATAASVTNNGTMTAVGVTTVNSPSTFVNNNTVTMSSQSAGVLAGTGTWTQGDNSTLNYAGSTLTVTNFNASNPGNTVNYNRTRGATIRNPTTNTYYNLSIDGTLSGAKTSSANHIVNGNLSITGNATTLDPLNFDFTVNGTTSITATGGGFNDSDNAGVNTFVGNVSVGTGASFVSTSVSTTGNLVFRGGIVNDGTFTAGGATFNTNNQSLTGDADMSFANNVAITGITVTSTHTGAFTITGTTTLTNGGFTDNDDTSVTTFVGAVSQTGTSAFNFTNVFTSGNLVFRGGITNNGGTFTAGGATFNTNSQAIAGNAAISFANFVIVTGVTVTNNNTSSVSLTRIPGGVTLAGTGNWTQGANSTLNYTGTSISVTGFDASAAGNTVNYNSTAAAQTIRVPTSTYTNLTFNNTFGTPPQLTAGGNLSISGILTMTSGRVNLNGNTLTLSSTAAGALVHGLTSSSGWAYGGSFVRTFANSSAITVGTAAGLFPLGSSSDWRPFFVGVNAVANTAGTITVSHTNSINTSDVSIADTNPVATIAKRHDSFWTVSTATMSGGTWNLRAGGENFGVIAAGAGDIRMATSTGVIGTNAAGSGGPTDWRVNRTGLTFGQLTNNFHVASTNASTSPLPVHLTYFRAKLNNNQVDLVWETAQELNNDFFTIEKTADLESFEDVVKRDGQGTTQQAHRYSAIDYYPYFGRSYYRLKQTDFDGKFSYSDIQTIVYEGSGFASLHAYPNPLQGSKLTIEVRGLQDTRSVNVEVISAQGQKIMSRTFEVKSPGSLQEELVFESPLPAGLYIIKAGQSLLLTQKIVIE